MINKKPTDKSGTQFVLKELENYRNIVRTELGFGEAIKTDPDAIWIRSVIYEEKN